MIICPSCNTDKAEDDFYVARRRGRVERQRQCKTCTKSMVAQWRKDNPQAVAKHKRNQKLKSYGITEETYETLADLQGGRCAICDQKPEGKLCVDHDHETGEVRGLLCFPCNLGLGHFLDEPRLLIAAADYVRKVR